MTSLLGSSEHRDNGAMTPSTAPLSPALMLFSPAWMRAFPHTARTLIPLLRRDSRAVLMDLMMLHEAYRAFVYWCERNPNMPIFLVRE